MILGFGTVSSPILWCAFTGNLHILTMYIWIEQAQHNPDVHSENMQVTGESTPEDRGADGPEAENLLMPTVATNFLGVFTISCLSGLVLIITTSTMRNSAGYR
jgi:hypothetical protein